MEDKGMFTWSDHLFHYSKKTKTFMVFKVSFGWAGDLSEVLLNAGGWETRYRHEKIKVKQDKL